MTFPCARAFLRHWPLPCLIVALAITHLGYAEEAKPAADPNDAQYAPRLTEIEQKIEVALAKQVNLQYIDTPLKDIVADLAKQVDLPISLSEEGLEELGLKPTDTITLDVGSVSLRETLRLLEIRHHLGYVPTATGLSIDSEESMGEREIVRVYPVVDLIRSDADDAEGIIFDYDTLIDAITSTYSPSSWTDNGGTSSISGFQGSLAVSQTLPGHHELARFFAAYRQAQRDHANAKPGEVGPVVSTRNSSKVREALNKRDSSSIDMELKWYVRDLTKLTGIPVVLDPNGLEEAGVTKDTFIRISYRDARVGDILRQVLKEHNLALAMFEEYVVVTSEERAGEISPETRFYPVCDLIDTDGSLLDFDSLIDLMTATVEPDSWNDNGGLGAVVGVPNPPTLIVSVTDTMHQGIEKLLTDLRANGAGKVRDANQNTADRIVQKIYPLYVARRELQAKLALRKGEPEKTAEKKPQAATPVIPSPGESNVMPQFGGAAPRKHQVAEPIPSSDEVAQLVEELLPDDSWEEEGVLLRPFHDVLIIRQHPAMHRKIERLLRDIDAWQGEAYNPFPIGSY